MLTPAGIRQAKSEVNLPALRAHRLARLRIDRPHPEAVAALAGQGIEVGDGQEPVEVARSIKSSDELDAIRLSIASTEIAMGRMREALRPGMTENELWSILHQTNIELDGEYVETRLLTSGHRTNPWFQECSAKTIAEGELLAFDTDVNAAFGYYADISRTWLVGDVAPSDEQRRLYSHAYDEIEHNLALMEPGMSFREYASRAWRIPDEFFANRYFVVAHGVGLSGEDPYIAHARDFDEKGYDGTIEPGMTFCIESYIGAKGGTEGVKLEEQVLVTEEGVERLSSYPYEEALLA